MNTFLHETFYYMYMCLKPGDVPLFDNAVVIFFSWFYVMRMLSHHSQRIPQHRVVRKNIARL